MPYSVEPKCFILKNSENRQQEQRFRVFQVYTLK